MKKRAFTLIEMMVVLVIVALLSALVLGAISSVREGNKRGSCQSNLNQIYAAARLYAQDNDGQFPYLNPSVSVDTNVPSQTPTGGMGLWSLYVYPVPSGQSVPDPTTGLPYSPDDTNQPATLSSYLKTPRAFHCPSDNFDQTVNGTTQQVSSGQLEYTDSNKRIRFNPYYLSYGGNDFYYGTGVNTLPYSTFRYSKATRQLRYFESGPPVITPSRKEPDQTVVTWCRFHRSLDSTGATRTNIDATRTFDNVLFLDGSVQSVPVEQTVFGVDSSGAPTQTYYCKAWGRVPLAEANATSDVVLQQFVSEGVCSTTP